MRRIAVLLLMSGLFVQFVAVAAGAGESAKVERLREATARYPDDPNLAWGLVRQLLSEGHPEAEARIRDFQKRWPRHQPEAGIQLGRILLGDGRLEEALASIESALEIEPDQAAGHIYRGIVLQRLDRTAAARDAIDEAARLSPELGPEVARLRAGMEPVAVREQDVVETDPSPTVQDVQDGSLASSPELERGEHGLENPSFGSAREPASDPLRFLAAISGEWDSNPDRQGRQGSSKPSDDDFKGLWELGLSFQEGKEKVAARSSWIPQFGAGYRFQGAQHVDAHERDNQRHQGFVSTRWRINRRLTARSLFLGGYDMRESQSYRWFALARPSLSFTANPRWGTTEIFGSVEHTTFFGDPSRSSFDLDGWEWGGGFRHRVRVPGVRNARATLGLRYSQLETEASRDSAGFVSPYDNSDLEGRVGLEVIMPWELRADLALAVGHAWYQHRNAIDFALGGSGRTRNDTWLSWRAALRRPLSRIVDLELSYRGIDSNSNIRFYDYTRHVIGIEIGVVWDYTPGRRAE